MAAAVIASRWPGHDNDSLQPHRTWHPLGATSEFRITDNDNTCRRRIFEGQNLRRGQDISEYRTMESGNACLIAHHTDVTFVDISLVSLSK